MKTTAIGHKAKWHCVCGKSFERLAELGVHIESQKDRRLHGVLHRISRRKKPLHRISLPRWTNQRLPRKGRRERFEVMCKGPTLAIVNDKKRGTLRLLWKYPEPPSQNAAKQKIAEDSRKTGVGEKCNKDF